MVSQKIQEVYNEQLKAKPKAKRVSKKQHPPSPRAQSIKKNWLKINASHLKMALSKTKKYK